MSKLFGKKDRDNENEIEEIDLDDELGCEGDLTDEEIEAAERYEEEHRDEYISTTSLDYDGDFVDYESLIDEDEEYEDDEEYEEVDDIDDESDESDLADVEAIYGGEEESEEEPEEELEKEDEEDE